MHRVDAVDLLIRKLELRDELSPAEQAALREAAGPPEQHPAHSAIVREGVLQTSSRLLSRGIVARAKILTDGSRQLTSLHVPGDFVDLHSLLLKKLDHDLIALTPVELIPYPHADLRRITETLPHLTRVLWLSTLMDGAIHREWLANAGRKPAVQRIACLFCEILLRHRTIGLAHDGVVPMPLTQIDLADACGLSPVHVNRVVQELREQGLITWRARTLTIHDFDQLAAFGQFDPAFLILEKEPR